MQGLNQLLNLVQNRYLGSSRKYLEHFFSTHPNPKIKGIHIRKNFLNLISSKMAPTILIKFCGLIVHSKPNNVKLTHFPAKIPKPTHQSRSNSIYTILLQIFLAIIFVFDLPLKLRVVHMRKKLILFFSKWLQRFSLNFVD